VLYSITNAEFRHPFALREEMRGWRLLQLDPALLRKPAPATVSDVLEADGSNLAAVLVRLKAETSSASRPAGTLADIASELNELIPGVVGLDAQLHEASREYRVELIMRDGLPFSSRVVSDGARKRSTESRARCESSRRGATLPVHGVRGVGRPRYSVRSARVFVWSDFALWIPFRSSKTISWTCCANSTSCGAIPMVERSDRHRSARCSIPAQAIRP